MSTVEPQDIMVALATNLRKYRTKAGISQKQLADSVGTSHPRISEIENGRGNPTLDTIEKIARVLNIQTIDLLRPEKPKK
jgi:transcriptional regulator with XRE-family HTH domain